MVLLLAWIVALLAMSAAYTIWKRNGHERHWKLPPGSMGLPIIGETFHFFKADSSSHLSPFFKERTKRYGPIFKTRILGKPVIVTADPELNSFILHEEGRLFKHWYPGSLHLFGKQSAGEQEGPMIKYLRGLALNLFGPDSLKQTLLSDIEKAASTNLESWLSSPSVEIKRATEDMIFQVTVKRLIGYDTSSEEHGTELREHFMDFSRGLFSVPLDIPGTAHRKHLQGRRKLTKMVESILDERLRQPREEQQDLLDLFVKELRKEGTMLTKEIALDLVLALLFTSFETTSTALTFCMKVLTDHPQVLDELTKEHSAILSERNHTARSWISWEEYKTMTYTAQVIKEVVRLSASFMLRRSLEDVNVKGYTIPKGWVVMLCVPAMHVNPQLYSDPLDFNPSRWEDPKLGGVKNFMAFGRGPRSCVGADFNKLVMTVFLHHLVTKYRWKKMEGGEAIRRPLLAFPNGFHIRLYQKN